MHKNRWTKRITAILFWVILWQTASMWIKNDIIFVGPVEVLQTLGRQIATTTFWKTIAYSFGKIGLGFISAFILGILLGAMAYRQEWFKTLLEPLVAIMKSIPVASFVILALIWMGSENLSVFIAFTIAFPVIYINTAAGLESTDKKLLEMSAVFQISKWKKIKYIYRTPLMTYLISGTKVALGMSWKAGIAAEVIGVPAMSIGERLYMSKIYLSTNELFAWTLVTIVVSVLFEKIFLFLLTLLQKRN